MFDKQPPKAKKVTDLLDSTFPDVASWVEPEILPKSGTLLFGGEAKIGKSWLMGEFARSLTTGKPLFDCPDYFYTPRKCRVLIIEQELGERGFQKRIKKTFENEPREIWGEYLFYESKRPELQLNESGVKYFADMIKDVKPNVLILDPISMMHTSDENSAQDVSKLFQTLEKFKKLNPEQEMSVIFSHHFGKPFKDQNGVVKDKFGAYNFRGSSKWKDTPDTLCTVVRGKDLELPWEAWEIHTRWITRHESSPPDMLLTVNQKGDDGRVRWAKNFTSGLRPLKETLPPENPLEKREDAVAVQQSFNI